MADRPDIAVSTTAPVAGALDHVGMNGVEMIVKVRTEDDEMIIVPAKADITVNLHAEEVRGIHMSRLYLATKQALTKSELTFDLLSDLTDEYLGSHKDISDSAEISITFDYVRQVPSLVTEEDGFRHYPTTFRVFKGPNGTEFEHSVTLTYSSTCPCSAALAEQLRHEEDIKATPHSQRSQAALTVGYADTNTALSLNELIDLGEQALDTAVLAFVKREDEQEFARKNGANLMFVEDAARKLKQALDQCDQVSGYDIKVSHLESLHAHDAVAKVSKK